MPEPAISERPDVDPDGRALTEAGLYRRWGLRVLRGTLAGIATVLVVGIPTDIIDTPMFGREVPVRAWELPVLLASAVLTAVWFGIDKPRQVERTGTPAALGVALTFFAVGRSEEHTSELQSLMRISYAVFCLKKKIKKEQTLKHDTITS